MRGATASDSLKVWLYAAASVAGGAWISPWLYNAGKALAEVTQSKRTNALLDALADWCREAGFPEFYQMGLLLTAVILLLPLIEWLKLGGKAKAGEAGSWSLRLPAGARLGPTGQPLEKSGLGAAHLITGFLLSGSIFLLIGCGLAGAGAFEWNGGTAGVRAVAKLFFLTSVMVVVQECVFRGAALGIFFRWLRPSAAIGLAALLFAAVHAVLPGGLTVEDPDRGGVGFELLRMRLEKWADPVFLATEILPLLLLGMVLGLARWRTASLALPIGLHAGWVFTAGWFGMIAVPMERPGELTRLLAGDAPGTGLLLAVGLLITGTLILQFTQPREHAGEL